MHHALEIHEVLSGIFHHFRAPSFDIGNGKPDPTLVALARTCRTFKEPALDALWMVLKSLHPLSLCLPEIVCRPHKSLTAPYSYAFSRPLTQTDWDTFLGYARRIRCIQSFNWSPHYAYFELLSEPPTSESLFPNLRYLHCRYNRFTMPLLNLPLPSLTNLIVDFENLELFQASFNSFPSFSPCIKEFSLTVLNEHTNSCRMPPNYLCRWKNLSSVMAPQFTLNVDDLVQLSCMSGLNWLVFSPSATPPYHSPLPFSNLQHLKLYSGSLCPISRLLLQSHLPAITQFQSSINDCPSREEFVSFLAGVLTSNPRHTIEAFHVTQTYTDYVRPQALVLGFEALQPCMTFTNLVHLHLSFACTVSLVDSDLLTLAAAWPKLEDLRINSEWGWSSEHGITPGGLVQLWRTCRSLNDIHVRLDTRGYTEVPPSEALESLRAGLTLPPTVRIDVLNAAIEADSVCALATFFCGIASCCESSIQLHYWRTLFAERPPNAKEYKARWEEVRTRVHGPQVNYTQTT